MAIRAFEIYRFTAARHKGPSRKCRCGRLQLQRQNIEIFDELFKGYVKTVVYLASLPGYENYMNEETESEGEEH